MHFGNTTSLALTYAIFKVASFNWANLQKENCVQNRNYYDLLNLIIIPELY